MTFFKVPPLSKSQRLDVFLSRHGQLTRAKVKNLLLAGHVAINGIPEKKAGKLLRGGEEIHLVIPPPQPSTFSGENIPLDILYEDEFLLAVNKPPGLVVHPAAGHWEGTLVNALLYHFEKLSGENSARPGIVHRLDKDTSGILLIAKNDDVHLALSRLLKERKIEKTYQALVCGRVLQEQGTINKPIGRHPKNRKKMAVVADGRPSVTHYKVLKRFKEYTLLECKLETGRTHQIRVHLASIGHPVAGDTLYGPGTSPEVSPKRQLLHAWKLTLEHPVNKKELRLEAPLPDDFKKALFGCRKI